MLPKILVIISTIIVIKYGNILRIAVGTVFTTELKSEKILNKNAPSIARFGFQRTKITSATESQPSASTVATVSPKL